VLTFTTPRSIEDVIAQSRHIIEAGTFEAFMRFMRAHVPAPPKKHVGVFTRMAVQQFQNWQLDENPKLRLSEAQLLAVMRVEFPLNEGKVFTGTLDEGLHIVGGIRADYNRTGHNGPTPQEREMPRSVSYGRF
jgi:hypothetical protein